MSGKVIVVANRKGGVGKTTTTLCLAKMFQLQRRSVVVVDTDPQASASLALAGRDMLEAELSGMYLERTLDDRRVYLKRQSMDLLRRRNVSALDMSVPLGLVPISPKFWRFEQKVRQGARFLSVRQQAPVRRYGRLLERLRAEYDLVIVDTPPGMGLLFEPSIAKANLLVVPCVPDRLSVWGLNVLRDELESLWRLPAGSLAPGAAAARGRVPTYVLWTRFAPNSNWRDQVQGPTLAPDIPFPYFVIEHRLTEGEKVQPAGIASYVGVAQAVTNADAASFQPALHHDLNTHLTNICTTILRDLGVQS